MRQDELHMNGVEHAAVSVRQVWRAQRPFIEKWGRPLAVMPYETGWILSTIDIRDFTSSLLLLDEHFKMSRVLHSGENFIRFCVDEDEQAVFFVESDLISFQNRKNTASCPSQLARLDMKTGLVTLLGAGGGKPLFAMNLALFGDDRLVVSDLANRQLAVLSRSGERLAHFDVGRRLVVIVNPDDEGVTFATYSSINSYFRTTDPYDCIYRMTWDGDIQLIHNTGLPGVPGNIYGLHSMGERVVYSSFHSIVMMDKKGNVSCELPMKDSIWEVARQEYCVGLFPVSASPDTVHAVSWGDSCDMIWSLGFGSGGKMRAGVEVA